MATTISRHPDGVLATSRADRIFRSAVSAFCAIPRPSRQQIAQIDDLGVPLVDAASTATLRFVAAALSECAHPPMTLVRLLCRKPVEICAPLLLRQDALTDVDLISIIGRQGIGHARVIARRAGLHPRILELINALQAAARQTDQSATPDAVDPLEEARERLRLMMQPAAHNARQAARRPGTLDAKAKLRSAALTGLPALFRTALADALGTSAAVAATIVADRSEDGLSSALHALGLSSEEAYVVASAVDPGRFTHPNRIGAFLDTHDGLDGARTAGRLRDWQLDGIGWQTEANARKGGMRVVR